jgi:hypothetical protein
MISISDRLVVISKFFFFGNCIRYLDGNVGGNGMGRYGSRPNDRFKIAEDG